MYGDADGQAGGNTILFPLAFFLELVFIIIISQVGGG